MLMQKGLWKKFIKPSLNFHKQICPINKYQLRREMSEIQARIVKEETKNWLKKAKNDLETAKSNFKSYANTMVK